MHRLKTSVAGVVVAVWGLMLPGAAFGATTVTDWPELVSAVSAGGTVQLGADIAAPSGGTLSLGGTPVTLDLNGFALRITAPASFAPAVGVGAADSLTIEDTSTGTPGTLTATGATFAAGIGAGVGGGGGTITINSGNVRAIGGFGGAGIGGATSAGQGDGGDGGSVSITGGTVTATGGSFGAGIGGGRGGAHGGDGETVAISGGTVTATSGGFAAGIGGGQGGAHGGDGATVAISGGTVTATGGDIGGPGIGGGTSSVTGGDGGAVTISGGTVTSNGGTFGAGIGGGNANSTGGAGGSVSVTGGIVNATGGSFAFGIGGGQGSGVDNGVGAEVGIESGAVLTASGAGGVPAFGGNGHSGGFGSLSNAGELVLPSGALLSVPSGVTVVNSGRIDLSGSLSGAGTVRNTGAILVQSGGSVAGNGAGDGTSGLLVEPNNFVVSFDLNGGPGSAPSTMFVYAGSLTASDRSLPAATPPAGTAFTGWFTAPAGGTRVDDGTDLRALAGDGPVSVALFAHYAAPVSVTTQPPAAAPPAPAGPAATAPAPAISRVWLGSRCVRRSRSGRVRVPINMNLARPAQVEIQIARATGSKAGRTCPQAGRAPRPRHKTRFRRVAAIRRTLGQAVAAAALAPQMTLNVRLTAGLYRLSVRAQLESGQMSAPIHRYLRVVG